jgi:hypothetical protein
LASFRVAGAQLAKGFLAIDHIATLDLFEPFDDQRVDLLRREVLSEVTGQQVMINRFVEKLVRVVGSAAPDFVLDESLKLRV